MKNSDYKVIEPRYICHLRRANNIHKTFKHKNIPTLNSKVPCRTIQNYHDFKNWINALNKFFKRITSLILKFHFDINI